MLGLTLKHYSDTLTLELVGAPASASVRVNGPAHRLPVMAVRSGVERGLAVRAHRPWGSAQIWA